MPRIIALADVRFVAPGDVSPEIDEVLEKGVHDAVAKKLVDLAVSQPDNKHAAACTRTAERNVLIRRHIIDRAKIDRYIDALTKISAPYKDFSADADKLWRQMTDKEREIADRIACEKWPGR